MLMIVGHQRDVVVHLCNSLRIAATSCLLGVYQPRMLTYSYVMRHLSVIVSS